MLFTGVDGARAEAKLESRSECQEFDIRQVKAKGFASLGLKPDQEVDLCHAGTPVSEAAELLLTSVVVEIARIKQSYAALFVLSEEELFGALPAKGLSISFVPFEAGTAPRPLAPMNGLGRERTVRFELPLSWSGEFKDDLGAMLAHEMVHAITFQSDARTGSLKHLLLVLSSSNDAWSEFFADYLAARIGPLPMGRSSVLPQCMARTFRYWDEIESFTSPERYFWSEQADYDMKTCCNGLRSSGAMDKALEAACGKKAYRLTNAPSSSRPYNARMSLAYDAHRIGVPVVKFLLDLHEALQAKDDHYIRALARIAAKPRARLVSFKETLNEIRKALPTAGEREVFDRLWDKRKIGSGI